MKGIFAFSTAIEKEALEYKLKCLD